MELEKVCNEWKHIARRMWVWFRMIFLLVITWDFFLTVVVQTSQRSLTLLGIGSGISIVVVLLWVICIFGLSMLLLMLIGRHGYENTRYSNIAFIFLGLTIFMYVILAILAVINLVAWPVVMHFCVMICWAGVLMYFRHRIIKLELLE